jgi:hypothetical protein
MRIEQNHVGCQWRDATGVKPLGGALTFPWLQLRSKKPLPARTAWQGSLCWRFGLVESIRTPQGVRRLYLAQRYPSGADKASMNPPANT